MPGPKHVTHASDILLWSGGSTKPLKGPFSAHGIHGLP